MPVLKEKKEKILGVFLPIIVSILKDYLKAAQTDL
jgi:hypothetical protein